MISLFTKFEVCISTHHVDVHDTHWRTKLTLSEMISQTRDMVGAHKNFNGSRDLTTPLSRMVCHPWASTCYHQPTYQIPNSTHYKDMKGDPKCEKWSGLG